MNALKTVDVSQQPQEPETKTSVEEPKQFKHQESISNDVDELDNIDDLLPDSFKKDTQKTANDILKEETAKQIDSKIDNLVEQQMQQQVKVEQTKIKQRQAAEDLLQAKTKPKPIPK